MNPTKIFQTLLSRFVILVVVIYLGFVILICNLVNKKIQLIGEMATFILKKKIMSDLRCRGIENPNSDWSPSG